MSLRQELHALVDRIADAIENSAAPEYVDQTTSPLGRQKHLRLAKRGVLPAMKEGRKVLIKRVDIERYLASKRIVAVNAAVDEEEEVTRVLATLGKGRR